MFRTLFSQEIIYCILIFLISITCLVDGFKVIMLNVIAWAS